MFLIASNTSEKVDDIMWNMPIMQAFKLVALIFTAKTGKEVKTHEEREIVRKQQEKFLEVQSG